MILDAGLGDFLEAAIIDASFVFAGEANTFRGHRGLNLSRFELFSSKWSYAGELPLPPCSSWEGARTPLKRARHPTCGPVRPTGFPDMELVLPQKPLRARGSPDVVEMPAIAERRTVACRTSVPGAGMTCCQITVPVQLSTSSIR